LALLVGRQEEHPAGKKHKAMILYYTAVKLIFLKHNNTVKMSSGYGATFYV